jgi:CheY-like chemotaxis protein
MATNMRNEPRVLIADDQPESLALLEGFCRENGYDVVAVTTARDVFESAAAMSPP